MRFLLRISSGVCFLFLLFHLGLGQVKYPSETIPFWDLPSDNPSAQYPTSNDIDTNTVLIWQVTDGRIHSVEATDPTFSIALTPDDDGYWPGANVDGSLGIVTMQRRWKEPGVYYFRDATFPAMTGMANVTQAEQNLSDDDDDDLDPLDYFNIVLGYIVMFLLVLSVIGAGLTIITFTIFSNIRTYPIKLIMYLCWCIIMSNTSFLFAFEDIFYDNEYVCYVTGMAVHYFYLANFCWTLCIAFNFYQMIVKRNRESEKMEKWYHLFCWGFPLGCLGWVSAFLEYGDRGGVCYITSPIFVFVFFFMPGLIIVSTNVVLFFFVAREIHETLATAPTSDKNERRKEFRVYISIFVSIGLSWIFGFLMVLFPTIVIRLFFLILFSITTPMQGFLIFLFYCVNAKVFGKWAGLFSRCLPFCTQWENLDSRSGTSSGRSTNSRSSLKSADTSFRSSSSMSARSNLWDSNSDDDEYMLDELDTDGFEDAYPMAGISPDEHEYLESSSDDDMFARANDAGDDGISSDGGYSFGDDSYDGGGGGKGPVAGTNNAGGGSSMMDEDEKYMLDDSGDDDFPSNNGGADDEDGGRFAMDNGGGGSDAAFLSSDGGGDGGVDDDFLFGADGNHDDSSGGLAFGDSSSSEGGAIGF